MYLKSAVNQYLKTDIPLNGILSTGRSKGRGLLASLKLAKRYPILGAIFGGIFVLVGMLWCLKKTGCCDEPEKEQTNSVVQQNATYPRQYAACDEPEKEQTNVVVQQDATDPRQYAACDEPEKEQTNAVVQQDATYPSQYADPEAQNLNTSHE